MSMLLPTTRLRKILTVLITLGMLFLGAGTAYVVKGNMNDATGEKQAQTENSALPKEVPVATVLELSLQSEPIVTIGNVVSVQEATVRAEAGGQLIRLYKDTGDYATAGELIGQLEQQSEVAALAQARAGLTSATAAGRISGTTQKSSKELLEETIVNSRNTLDSAYDNAIEAVEVHIDGLFSNPKSTAPVYNPVVTNSQLENNIVNQRVEVNEVIENLRVRKGKLSSFTTVASLQAEIDATRKDVDTIKKLTDNVLASLSQVVITPQFAETTRDGYKAAISGAQGTLSGSLSSLSGSKDNLTAKAAQSETGNLQAGEGTDTTSAAAIAQAKSMVTIAEANLERKNIRAPISGTINSLPIKEGDTIGGGQTVAVIGNNQALEIRSYITENERNQLSVGGKALINGVNSGTITRISPSADPRTRKIEVRVLPTGGPEQFENGVAVEVRLLRQNSSEQNTTTLSVPVSAVRITSEGAVVFAVENGVLVERAIIEGPLMGKSVVVNGGLTPDVLIVTDARGLKPGMKIKAMSSSMAE